MSSLSVDSEKSGVILRGVPVGGNNLSRLNYVCQRNGWSKHFTEEFQSGSNLFRCTLTIHNNLNFHTPEPVARQMGNWKTSKKAAQKSAAGQFLQKYQQSATQRTHIDAYTTIAATAIPTHDDRGICSMQHERRLQSDYIVECSLDQANEIRIAHGMPVLDKSRECNRLAVKLAVKLAVAKLRERLVKDILAIVEEE